MVWELQVLRWGKRGLARAHGGMGRGRAPLVSLNLIVYSTGHSHALAGLPQGSQGWSRPAHGTQMGLKWTHTVRWLRCVCACMHPYAACCCF